MAKITIEVDERDALVRHIEDLQRVITKRNAQIASLEARLDAGEESPLIVAAFEKGQRQGWADCANRLMGATYDAARKLGEVRQDAFQAVLEGERAARERYQAEQERVKACPEGTDA